MRGLNLGYFDIPALRPGTVGAYGFAFLCVGTATAILIVSGPYAGGVQFIPFLPAVAITALFCGFRAGLFCIVLSTVAADFLVLHPRFSLHIENPGDVLDLLLFVSFSLFLVTIVASRRHSEQDLQMSKGRLQFALDAAEVGWWEYDPLQGTLWWDARTRRLFNVAGARTDIEEFKKRVHPDDIKRVWAAVEAALDPTDPKPYATEYRIQPGPCEIRWVEAHGLARFEGSGHRRRAVFMVGTGRDITERKRLEAEHAQRDKDDRLLILEINHRAKNVLSVVDSIAHQTATRNPEDFVERFSQRIQALSANQDLLVRNEWRGVDVEDLVRGQLAHFADLIDSRIAVQGPKLRLNAASAQAIGLALYELATNATKYGALSADTGCVDVSWRADGDAFTMIWTEREGPPASAPEQRGFGTIVMKTMAEQSVGGEVSLDYAPSGVTWRLTCPALNALEPAGGR